MNVGRSIRKGFLTLALLGLVMAAIGVPAYVQGLGSSSGLAETHGIHADHANAAHQRVSSDLSGHLSGHSQSADHVRHEGGASGSNDCEIGDCCPPTIAALATGSYENPLVSHAFGHWAPYAPPHAELKISDRPPRLS